MDTLRGQFDALDETGAEPADAGPDHEVPSVSIGTDERRMQVRAYNHWAGLLQDHSFPAIEDLEPANLPDFGPFSVLLDFTSGIDNPVIAYLGADLAEECGIDIGAMKSLADVPPRSLLTRITDHYMQILGNQAPVGFEAEFVNQRSKTILYRGILLPFSSDDELIDFIYGVINWKELAEQHTADELLLEIDQALDPRPPRAPLLAVTDSLTDWADGPGAADAPAQESRTDDGRLPQPSFGSLGREPLSDEASFAASGDDDDAFELDEAMFAESEYGVEEGDEDEAESNFASLAPAEPGTLMSVPRKKPILLGDALPEEPAYQDYIPSEPEVAGYDLEPDDESFFPQPDPADMELGDWLAAARDMAATARSSEDRTRGTLYEAIGRAYDFSIAASAASEDFTELLSDAGLTVQDRAPMTPVVKLVFGADYDKTRLTEYAAALAHGHRLGLPQGALGGFLAQAEGGLKGVVKAERRMRREDAGQTAEAPDAPRQALARKLRALPEQDFAGLEADGAEFALVMIRRTEDGVVMLGEVPDDVALVEKAARRLLG